MDFGIIKKCNNNCIMCTNVMPYKGKEIKNNEIIDIIKKTKDNTIIITGGEPTLKKNLIPILKYINLTKPNVNITLITNARFFYYDKVIKHFLKIKKLKIITELYASNEKLHDNITKTKNSFKETFKGIKNLINNKIDVELRVVINKLNYKDTPSLIKLYNEEFEKVNTITLFPIDFVGNAAINFNKLKYTYKKITPYIEKAIDICPNKINLYHIPFCTISKKYWKNIQSVTVIENRITFSKLCKNCKFEDKCPRIWKSYANKIGLQEFKKII